MTVVGRLEKMKEGSNPLRKAFSQFGNLCRKPVVLDEAQQRVFEKEKQEEEKGIKTFEEALFKMIDIEFPANDRQSFKIDRLSHVETVIKQTFYEAMIVPHEYYVQNNISYPRFSKKVETKLEDFMSKETDPVVADYADFILRTGRARVGAGIPPEGKEAEKFHNIVHLARQEEADFMAKAKITAKLQKAGSKMSIGLPLACKL